MKTLAVGILALCLLNTSGSALAESDIGTTRASVGVRFVIHIPETLSLSIKASDTVTRQATLFGNGVDPNALSNADRPSVSVRALGNLSMGGAMALTADSAVSSEGQPNEHDPLAMVTWTAKNMDIAGGSRVKDFLAETIEPINDHIFLYQKEHSLKSISNDQPIYYTISSP